MEKLYTVSENKTRSSLVAQIMNTLLQNSSRENHYSIQFSSCSVMSNSLQPPEPQHTRPPFHHQLPESTQPSYPLLSLSPPAFNLSHLSESSIFPSSLLYPAWSLASTLNSCLFITPRLYKITHRPVTDST